MENKGCSTIPRILFENITYLTRALPLRSVPTFIELLIGAMITQSGFVTQAWLAINPLRTWTSYYKWLKDGKWSWVALGVQLAKMVVRFYRQPNWFLIFDDTFIYRNSKKAPGSGIFHQHGNKANRPVYARGQCWVSLALSISTGIKHSAIPLLSRLMRVDGNNSKLEAAKTLTRVIAPVFTGSTTFILMDSWYMKWPLLGYLLDKGFHVIGQVRKDTALYDFPTRTGKRGRPAKYGTKFTADVVADLPEEQDEVFLYGKKQKVRYRSAKCLARFMKDTIIRAVWMQFEDEQGNLSKPRIIISSQPYLSAEDVFIYYAKRWAIEDLFNQMKNRWGWREAWQQSRQVLHRWTQILSVAYALPQLLATYIPDEWNGLAELTPWRKKQPVTAGRVRMIMQMILGNVRVRGWWNPKYRKFEPPDLSDVCVDNEESTQYWQYVMSKNDLNYEKPPPT
jgi:hypothetical protein